MPIATVRRFRLGGAACGFTVPLVFANQRRPPIAIEKGAPANGAFIDGIRDGGNRLKTPPAAVQGYGAPRCCLLNNRRVATTNVRHELPLRFQIHPKTGVGVEQEVCHGETSVYAGVQA